MRVYELIPTDGRKSFYHKARVEVADDGTETLISYNTPVLRRNTNGTLSRLWPGWTATTGRHVAAFAGLTMEDTDKVCRISGGGFALKTDLPTIRAFIDRPNPLLELMKDQAFAESAFLYEMQNHEYGINWQGDWDVCNCFGNCEYATEKSGPDYLREMGYDENVVNAYTLARRRYYKLAEENEWF